MTLSMSVDIADRDIIKMIEEFLANRHLDISLMCVERESGIINGVFSDDGLFLRQLILDGHWDDTLEFLQPLEGVEGYNKNLCQYLIYKHKYLELLCIKHDPGPLQNHEFTLDEVISCLNELEVLCTDRKEYDNFCFLLTLPSITADKTYKDWNPSSARINCFNELYPLVKKFVGLEKRPPPHSSSKHDRLLNLLTKGILYEMCVELCTARACGSGDSVTANHPLGGTPCSDADLSLVSWLQKVPVGTFACPFEKKTLKLKIDKLDKPSLEAVWSEQLLSTPIRPKQFPHTSIPARTRSSQLVSQSMMAMYDGLSSNLFMPHGMKGSMSEPRNRHLSGSPHLSKSFAHSPTAKFLLTSSLRSERRSSPMNQSMERLFITSGRSSPRLHTSSPLVKDDIRKFIKPEVISPPGFPDNSPTMSSTKVLNSSTQNNTPHHAEPHPAEVEQHSSRHQQSSQQPQQAQKQSPPQSLHQPQQLRQQQSPQQSSQQSQQLQQQQQSRQQQSPQQLPRQLHGSQTRSQADHTSVYQDSSHESQRESPSDIRHTPSGKSQTSSRPISTSESLQNSSHDNHLYNRENKQENLPGKPQGNYQKPDILQHDVKMSSEVAGSVKASQDLYAQFQEQKRRVEEELRLMEQRNEQWQQLRDGENTNAVPKLDLNSSESFQPPGSSCQPPDSSSQPLTHDISDDVQHEVGVLEDAVEIKQFVAVETLEEQGPVRAIAFHPSGECYAVGSNTKILRVCQYPDMSKVTTSYHMPTRKPKILAKKVKHHGGSIYCVAWNTLGTVIATGSNDHSVKCVQWLSDQSVFGSEKSLSVHDGTVRDVSFLSTDQLLSAGAGDCTVCLTDIASGSVVRRYKGHTGHVLSLFPHRDSQKFVSGGQDKKCLMWDTRMSVPVQTYQCPGSLADSAFASVCLDPAPRVLASGHDNSYCSLYDLRQGRMLQAWKPHTDEVRSARFNADATYFLSGSYDTTVKLMDMQGDITQPLKTVQVAEHMDKVIQSRWHPLLPSFITSSADKTVTCWAIQIDE